MRGRTAREAVLFLAFVARCSGAALVSYVLAMRFGLDHPVWATVSALVVSQERLGDTHRSLLWRLLATAVGIAVAVAGGIVRDLAQLDRAVILCVVVALCAALTRWRPGLRVSMWTAAIVILTTTSEETIWETAIARGAEVLLGGLVGAVLHLLADRLVGAPKRRGEES